MFVFYFVLEKIAKKKKHNYFQNGILFSRTPAIMLQRQYESIRRFPNRKNPDQQVITLTDQCLVTTRTVCARCNMCIAARDQHFE